MQSFVIYAQIFPYTNLWRIILILTGPHLHVVHLPLDSLQDNYLFQHILRPTRYQLNTIPHTLDLILTNEEEMVNNIKYLPGICNSNHVCVQFDVICYHSLLHNTLKPLYNLKLAD